MLSKELKKVSDLHFGPFELRDPRVSDDVAEAGGQRDRNQLPHVLIDELIRFRNS
jgi:hypothetical protein